MDGDALFSPHAPGTPPRAGGGADAGIFTDPRARQRGLFAADGLLHTGFGDGGAAWGAAPAEGWELLPTPLLPAEAATPSPQRRRRRHDPAAAGQREGGWMDDAPRGGGACGGRGESPCRTDRLVPDRPHTDGAAYSVGSATYQLPGKLTGGGAALACGDGDDTVESYKMDLASSLFGSAPSRATSRILPIGERPRDPRLSPLEDHNRNLRVIYTRNKKRNFKSKSFRYIPQTPERILDAPDLIDDYYLNLLDWSCGNVLVVALNQTVYLWNAETGDIQQLTQTTEEDNIVTSVSFSQDGSTLAVGTNSAEVELWDVQKAERVRTLKGHLSRVGSLAWSGRVLASGSRDSMVLLHDSRAGSGHLAQLTDHHQEVCGLKWSLDGTQLASGGNDNLLHIWDNCRLGTARLRLSAHTAAVKALGWSPHQSNLLASGGGTADRTLRFWNTSTGDCLSTIDTKSQVCSVIWATHLNELLTSHGFTENQLSLWKYPSMKRLASLTGHSSRVLHLALSPDGQTVVSAAGDETIRFWKCFAVEKAKSLNTLPSSTSPWTALTLR